MNPFDNPILAQLINNVVILLVAIIIVSFMMRTFFWQYIKVRLSFGKYILIKVRSINRDYFKVGSILDGCLLYTYKDAEKKKQIKRIPIPKDQLCLYRSIGVTWIDLDEESNNICGINYNTIAGFDAVRFEDLYKRALMKPVIQEEDMLKWIKIGAICAVIAILVAGVAAVLAFKGMQNSQAALNILNAMQQAATAVPKPGI